MKLSVPCEVGTCSSCPGGDCAHACHQRAPAVLPVTDLDAVREQAASAHWFCQIESARLATERDHWKRLAQRAMRLLNHLDRQETA